nr:DUF4055 domain-containing protein [uncultured Roseovarius sp.]
MSDSVAKRSAASQAMLDAAAKGRALMGGTTAMRAAGETYLPRFEAESPEAYDSRLAATWLFNGYRKTVRDMTGRVFDVPVELAEGANPRLVEWAENIDMQGQDLSTFLREVFEDALAGSGIGWIMVDAPPRTGGETQEIARQANLRPYFVHLRVEDVLGWKAETINNVMTLTQIRIFETVEEPDPEDEFLVNEVEQIRVLDRMDGLVQTRIYRQAAKDARWVLHGEPTFAQTPEITVVPFYANRSGFFTGAPLLDDLADVNIAHWQSQSDQRNILHVARVPILFGAGAVDDDDFVISASMMARATDPNAKLEWVEHTGAAIGAGRQDLKDLEFQMEAHGLQLLVAANGAQSATGETLDAKKETSTLSMTADQLQDATEQAIAWLGHYGGFEIGEGSVTVNKEFGVSMLTAQDVTAMLSAVNTGNMSRRTFIGEMKRRGFIRSDMDVDEELERIEEDGANLMEAADAGQ